MPVSPKPKKQPSTSVTRKRSNKRSPKHFTNLEYLRDKSEARKRASSFNATTLTDEEFFKFFEEIGEVKKSSSRSRGKTRKRKN